MKPNRLAPLLALSLFAACASVDAQPATLPAWNATYTGTFRGIPVGDVNVSLKPEGESGCYVYLTTSKPAGFVRALYGSPNQTSHFCVKDGKVVSKKFEAVLDGDEEQSYTLDFAADGKSVTDKYGNKREIPAGTVDNFALQQAVRLWVMAHYQQDNPPIAEFDMVDRKNLTHYQFRLSGREDVITPAGAFNAIVMERIDNPKKKAKFWIAPQKDLQLVKSEVNAGAGDVTLLLKP